MRHLLIHSKTDLIDSGWTKTSYTICWSNQNWQQKYCILITLILEVLTSLKVFYVWGGRRGHLTWFHKIRFMFMFMFMLCLWQLYTVIGLPKHTWAVLKAECWFTFRFSCCAFAYVYHFVCLCFSGLASDYFARVVCFCCVRFSFFSTTSRDWLWRTYPKLSILCGVRCNTLTWSM